MWKDVAMLMDTLTSHDVLQTRLPAEGEESTRYLDPQEVNGEVCPGDTCFYPSCPIFQGTVYITA